MTKKHGFKILAPGGDPRPQDLRRICFSRRIEKRDPDDRLLPRQQLSPGVSLLRNLFSFVVANPVFSVLFQLT